MMTERIYKSQIFSATHAPFDLRLQYGTMRYHSFTKDDPFLNMNHINKVEFDKFDERESTLFIFAWAENKTGGKRELISAVRLIPTVLDYDLEADSWSYLTEGLNLPKTPEIFEYSRWVAQPKPRTPCQICTSRLGIELYHLGQRLGIKQFIGVATTALTQYMKNKGLTLESLTAPISTDRDDDTLEVYIQDLDLAFMASAYKKYARYTSKEQSSQVLAQASSA